MSLPLPRRFAQAALLLGAAAAPLLGAGAAHAAAPAPQGLGGLTGLDHGALGPGGLRHADVSGPAGAVGGAAHQATTPAGRAGTRALATGLPAADHVVGTVTRTDVPAAQQAVGRMTDAAGRTAGATTESAGGSVPGAEGLPASALPNTGALPTTGPLTDRLPLGGGPLGSVPAL